MAVNSNIRRARNSGISLTESQDFIESIDNHTLARGGFGNDAYSAKGRTIDSALVFVGRHELGPDDGYCRPESDWVSGLKDTETPDGTPVVRNLDRQGYRRNCGTLALMRQEGLQGYSKGIGAKVTATLYTREGEKVTKTFFVNRVQEVVATGPADATDPAEAESAEDQD